MERWLHVGRLSKCMLTLLVVLRLVSFYVGSGTPTCVGRPPLVEAYCPEIYSIGVLMANGLTSSGLHSFLLPGDKQ